MKPASNRFLTIYITVFTIVIIVSLILVIKLFPIKDEQQEPEKIVTEEDKIQAICDRVDYAFGDSFKGTGINVAATIEKAAYHSYGAGSDVYSLRVLIDGGTILDMIAEYENATGEVNLYLVQRFD